MEDNVIVIVFRFSYQTKQKLGNSLSVIVPASASPHYSIKLHIAATQPMLTSPGSDQTASWYPSV